MNYFLKITILFFYSNISIANNLTCSKNGTDIFLIPGLITSQTKQTDTNDKHSKIAGQILLDSSNKTQINNINIQSSGLINEKFNYLLDVVAEKYGKENAENLWLLVGASEVGLNISSSVQTFSKAGKIFSTGKNSKSFGTINKKIFTNVHTVRDTVVDVLGHGGTMLDLAANDKYNNLLSDVLKIATSDSGSGNLNRFGKWLSIASASTLSPVGVINALNFLSIVALEGSGNNWIDAHRANLISTHWDRIENVNNIADQMENALKDNKKIIISANAEGNILAKRAIEKLKSSSNNELATKLDRFVSVLATSPTTSPYSKKYIYMKNNFDIRIFEANNDPFNYLLKPNNNSNSANDIFNAFFLNTSSKSDLLDDYMSDSTNDIATEVSTQNKDTMYNFYVNNLVKSAESLDSNCGKLPLLTSPDFYDDKYDLNTFNIYKDFSKGPVNAKINVTYFIPSKENPKINSNNEIDNYTFNWVIMKNGNVEAGSTYPIPLDNLEPGTAYQIDLYDSHDNYTDYPSYDPYTHRIKQFTIQVHDKNIDFNINYSQVSKSEMRAALNISSTSRLFVNNYTYEWDLGFDKKIGNSINEVFPTEGIYPVNVLITDLTTKQTFNISKDVIIEPPASIEIIKSSYNFLKLVDKNPDPSLGGLLHSRQATFLAKGPVGTQFLFPEVGKDDVQTLECGKWILKYQSGNKVRPYCERVEGSPQTTIISAHNVTQCGGQGCVPRPLGLYYIPFNIDDLLNAGSYEYTGEIPKPFMF